MSRPMHGIEDSDRRRTRRIPLSVPLEFAWRGLTHRARTEDLNRDGALVQSPITCPAGTILEVTNLYSRRKARFRVVWAWFGEREGTGRYRLGLESVDLDDEFWGVSFAIPEMGATSVR